MVVFDVTDRRVDIIEKMNLCEHINSRQRGTENGVLASLRKNQARPSKGVKDGEIKPAEHMK